MKIPPNISVCDICRINHIKIEIIRREDSIPLSVPAWAGKNSKNLALF